MTLAMPEFFKQNGYKDVDDPKRTPLQLGHHTDLTSWEYMKSRPEWANDLVLMLNGRRVGMPTWLSVYPMEEAKAVDPQQTLFVDVGGGAGPQCKALKKEYPHLPGRVVLQDKYLKYMLPHGETLEGVETMEHDFFEPQPVRGRVLHLLLREHLLNSIKEPSIITCATSCTTTPTKRRSKSSRI